MAKSVNVMAIFVLVWLICGLLVVGSYLIIPFIIALFIWHLLNSTCEAFKRIPKLGTFLPNGLRMILAIGLVVMAMSIVGNIITNNVNLVIEAAPRYQENLIRIFKTLDNQFHFNTWLNMDSLLKSVSVQGMLINFYGVFSSLMGSAVLIGMYVAFLFVEQHFFAQKLIAFFPQAVHRTLVNNILGHIAKDTQTYLGLKTFMSFITAIASWLIMRWLGLDFAEFWALLIFFLNYIPNIGAIIATAFPALLALIQFSSWMPFIEIISGITLIQFMIGNIVEPRLMGRSLNLSPLIILIALGIWGAIWGILGMFLAVPITVIMMIIFARFEKTRGLAILLSQNGQIEPRENEALGDMCV